MFPTTRVVELSWLARCVVRPARPTAFNRCVCSPFLASVSLRAYRVFGNCRIQPERSSRVPGHEARLDLPLDLPPFREQSSFVSAFLFLSFFFFFLSKPTALTNCFRSQFNANRPWRRIKNVFERIVTRTIGPQTSRKARWELYSVSSTKGLLSDLLVILCLLTVYICVFAHSTPGDRRIHILTRIMTTFTSSINERTSRRASRYWAAIPPLKITHV